MSAMKYRRLGRTDLDVSVICLGTMTWGVQNSEAEAFAQMDYAWDRGVNWLDTAEMYPVPPTQATQGATETIIGNWMKARGNRDRVIVATKVAGRQPGSHIRPPESRLDARNVKAALDASLTRLQTDYVDLYQVHWPERQTNYFGKLGYLPADDADPIGIGETLEALAAEVKAGRVRHIGVSNETPWGVMSYLAYAERHGLPRIASVQNPYSLLNRSFEVGLAEIAHRESVDLLAYSPLAMGALSGKYLEGKPPGARMTIFDRFTRYLTPVGHSVTRRYVDLARAHGLDPSQMALAYVNSRPFTGGTIIGATNLDQLALDIGSIDLDLPKEVLDGIEAIHRECSNPCP
jgi:aryl-alcohol dehydrogenase-like predicted oxidoreductase